MIIFTPAQYEAWSSATAKAFHAIMEAQRARNRIFNGRHPEHSQEEKDAAAAAYMEEIDRITAESDTIAIPILQDASRATVATRTPAQLLEDGTAVIMLQAWAEMGIDEHHGMGGYFEGHVTDIIDALRRSGDAKRLNTLQKLFKRYKAGEITEREAEPYKEFMPYEVAEPTAEPGPEKDTAGQLLQIPGTKYPTTFVYPNDLITNMLFASELTPGKPNQVRVSSKNAPAPIDTFVAIDYSKLDNVTFTTRDKTLATFDSSVLNAVITLYVEGGNQYITPEAVYKIMTGDTSARVQPAMRQKIVESLDALSGTRAIIKADQEAAGYKGMKTEYKGYVLNMDQVTVKKGSETADVFQINKMPVLYQYAAAKGQIGRAPVALLKTPGRTSEELINLRGYLLQRVGVMKNPKNRISTNIRFETIFNRLGLLEGLANDDQERKKRAKVYKAVTEILTEWQGQGFIKGFTLNYKGAHKKQGYESVTIDP